MPCDCCGETFEDPVAHLLIEEAVVAYLRALERQSAREEEAWAAAEEQLRAAHV